APYRLAAARRRACRTSVMADSLTAVAFTADMLDHVRSFHYGDEAYQKELGDWMANDAIRSMATGTKVWLYATESDVVGYGSLGVTRWHFPQSTSPKLDLLIIPAVALRSCY